MPSPKWLVRLPGRFANRHLLVRLGRVAPASSLCQRWRISRHDRRRSQNAVGRAISAHCGCIACARRFSLERKQCISAVVAKLVNDYRLEEAEVSSGSMRASGLTISSASLFSSSFASDSSSKVSWRSSADLSCPSSCAKVRTLP